MKIHFSRKQVVAAVIVVACLGVGGFLFANKNDRQEVSGPTGSTDVGPNFINYGPPTDEERADADQHKDNLVQQMQNEGGNQTSDSSNKKQVKPVITNIDTINNEVTITAYISGVFEEGGTCTLRASKGSEALTFTGQAFTNATTTDCTPFRISPAEFSGGEWSFQIDYSSNTAQGNSDVKKYEIE